MKDRLRLYTLQRDCLIEDLRMAAQLCEKKDFSLACALRRYADDFSKIKDENYWEDNFGFDTEEFAKEMLNWDNLEIFDPDGVVRKSMGNEKATE